MQPRIRTVKFEFFLSRKLYEAEQQTGLPIRIGFAGLWCFCDREGRFEWKPDFLGHMITPFDGVSFDDVLGALCAIGSVQRYEVDGEAFGFISSWANHQRIRPDEAQSRLPAPPDPMLAPLSEPDRIRSTSTESDRGRLNPGRGTGTGTGTGTVKNPPPARKRAAADAGNRTGPPDEAVLLAELLAELMRANDSKAKVPSKLTAWATEIDCLHRIDGRDWPMIERVLRWSQTDSFWRTNILSAHKLRQKFPQLVLRSGPASATPGARRESVDDELAVVGAGMRNE